LRHVMAKRALSGRTQRRLIATDPLIVSAGDVAERAMGFSFPFPQTNFHDSSQCHYPVTSYSVHIHRWSA